MTANYKWYGDKALGSILQQSYDGMVDIAMSITKEAKRNANQPKGSDQHPQVKTGTMRRSITFDVKRKGKDIEAKVGIMSGKKKGAKALEYAADIEFGAQHHPPYPFLFPAVESHRARIKDFFK